MGILEFFERTFGDVCCEQCAATRPARVLACRCGHTISTTVPATLLCGGCGVANLTKSRLCPWCDSALEEPTFEDYQRRVARLLHDYRRYACPRCGATGLGRKEETCPRCEAQLEPWTTALDQEAHARDASIRFEWRRHREAFIPRRLEFSPRMQERRDPIAEEAAVMTWAKEQERDLRQTMEVSEELDDLLESVRIERNRRLDAIRVNGRRG